MTPADATAADLPHEIAGPVWYLPFPLPVMIAAGVLLAVLLGLAIWAFVAWRRRVARRPLTPLQRALAEIGRARAGAADAAPNELRIAGCGRLRS